MIIALAVYGSLGDVQPLTALARALSARGHEVRLAAPPEYENICNTEGVSFTPLGSNLREFLSRIPDVSKLSAVGKTAWFLLKEFKKQLAALDPMVKDADLAIGASLCLGLRTKTIEHQIPYRFAAFCPQLLPSSHHPNFLIKNHDRPAWFNRLSWSAVRMMDLFGARNLMNREHRRLGLPLIKDFWGHFLGEEVIVASDAELAPIPPDSTHKSIQTGYWRLPGQGELSPELKEFLASGDPPVYAGLGSMTSGDAARVTDIFIKAARAAGKRLIISRGWADLGRDYPEPDVLVIGPTPHEKLFPHLSAVIHHGGSGTTHTAAGAGAPQVIIPHILDQFYWGSRVYRKGLGPRPVSRTRLKADLLAASLGRAVNDRSIKKMAVETAERMGNGDPIGNAVAYIENQT